MLPTVQPGHCKRLLLFAAACCVSKSEVELRKYRDSLNLPDPSGASGAVIPLTEVIIASTQETLRAVLVSSLGVMSSSSSNNIHQQCSYMACTSIRVL